MKTVNSVSQKLSRTYLNAGVVATTAFLPMAAFATEDGAAGGLTADLVKSAVSDIGLPLMIGGAVSVMLGIAALIWGGKKIIGFFSK